MTVCLEDLSPQDSVGRQEQRRKLTHMDKVGWKGNSCTFDYLFTPCGNNNGMTALWNQLIFE